MEANQSINYVEGDEGLLCANWDNIDNWKELAYPENAVLLTADQKMSVDIVNMKESARNNLIDNKFLLKNKLHYLLTW